MDSSASARLKSRTWDDAPADSILSARCRPPAPVRHRPTAAASVSAKPCTREASVLALLLNGSLARTSRYKKASVSDWVALLALESSSARCA